MSLFAWLKRLVGAKADPKPAPPLPLDEQPGIIGDLFRLGEAVGGNAQQAEHEQQIANTQEKKP